MTTVAGTTPHAAALASLLSTLNDDQRAAASAGPEPLLIVAGAGTGKTATLAHRVAYLIATGADPGRILLLTFTRRASGEMVRRVDALLRGAATTAEEEAEEAGLPVSAFAAAPNLSGARVWGGTFHAVAARLLHIHATHIGLEPDFTIIDQETAASSPSPEPSWASATMTSRFPQKSTSTSTTRCVDAELPRSPEVLGAAFPLVQERPRTTSSPCSPSTPTRRSPAGLRLRRPPAVLARRPGASRGRRAHPRALRPRAGQPGAQPTCRPRSSRSCVPTQAPSMTCVGDDARRSTAPCRPPCANILDFEAPAPRRQRAHAHARLPLQFGDPRRDQRDHRPGRRSARQRALDRARGRRSLRLVACTTHGPTASSTTSSTPRAGHAPRAPGACATPAAPLDGARTQAPRAQRALPPVRRPALHRDGARQGPVRVPSPRREPRDAMATSTASFGWYRHSTQTASQLIEALFLCHGDFGASATAKVPEAASDMAGCRWIAGSLASRPQQCPRRCALFRGVYGAAA